MACSCKTITGDIERFHFLNLETDFLKYENFFKKIEHRFLVEITAIENAIFPYKTALSEIKAKTNRMEITKSITKNFFLPLATLFLENLISA